MKCDATTAAAAACRLPYQGSAAQSKLGALLQDPDVLAACEKRKLMVEGATGEEIDEIVRETLRLPQAVADKIGQMMQ